MFCGLCGTKRGEGNFCGNCGQPFPVAIIPPVSTPDPIPKTSTDLPPTSTQSANPTSTPIQGSGLVTALVVLGLIIVAGAGVVIYQETIEEQADIRVSQSSTDDSKGQKKSKKSFSLFSATDVDDPNDFPYVKKEESCSRGLISTARGATFELDRQIRSGESSISLEEEEDLGKQVLEHVESEMNGRLVQSSQEAKYIAAIGEELAKHASRKEITYKFYLLEDTDVENAFALPGGYVVVTRPLYNTWVDNEAQLATVIGHEIIHVDQKHTTALYEYTRKILKTSEDDEIALFIAQTLTKVAYSTEREAESDELGAELIHKEGYSTFQSVRVWEKVHERYAGSDSQQESSDNIFTDIINEGLKEVESVLASHPDPAYRACNLKKKTYRLYQETYHDKPYVGKKNYSTRKSKRDKEY